MFTIIDGIDGCGKGTIANVLVEHRRRSGARVFDLRAFTKQEHRLPDLDELRDVDVIVSGEPTYAWVGAAIREELIRTHERSYRALDTAAAYALDRLILWRRVLLPARDRGIDIIQERSVTTSIVYQPLQAEPLALETILALEGNRFCLAHPPDHCMLVSTEPARAMQRLQLRTEKQDAAIFERLPMLESLHERFQSAWFRALLAEYHWPLATLDANGAVEDAVAQALQICGIREPVPTSS